MKDVIGYRRLIEYAVVVTVVLAIIMLALQTAAHDRAYDCLMRSSYDHHVDDLRVISTAALMDCHP